MASPVSDVVANKALVQPGQAEVIADVMVIGGGNAALCAAICAAESGASVVLFQAHWG